MACSLHSVQLRLHPSPRTRLEMGQALEDAGCIVTVQAEKITLRQVEGGQCTLLPGQCQRFFPHLCLGIAYQYGWDTACEHWQVVAAVAGKHCIIRTEPLQLHEELDGMELGSARRQDIQQTHPVHFVDAPDEIGRDPLSRQALSHGLPELYRIQVGGGVVAELVAVLLFRLLQAQFRQIPQVAVQGLRRCALPVLGDVTGPGGFLAPLACLDMIQGGTHVTDGKVRHRDGVITNGLLQQLSVAAADIDQGDFGTGDHTGEQGPRQEVFRFVAVGQHCAVQVATQQDFRRVLHGAQHTCPPRVQETLGTRSPSSFRSSRLIRSHFIGGIEMEWVLLGILVLVVVFAVVIYNRLVTARNRYKNAFAQIDVQLTRRYDLIPNLVKVAERYMSHERDTLEAVIQARNQAMGNLKEAAADPGNAEAMRRLSSSEQGLAGALGRLFALSENYPDLKANQNMMQLSEELVSTENRVAFARQGFNDAVMDYNNQREMFPNNLIANNFGFQPAELLDIEAPEKRAPMQVDFQ